MVFYVGGLFLLGIFPVISRILAERRPSPYGHSWAHVETVQPQVVITPQFQQNIQLEQNIQTNVNDIPVFSPDEEVSFEPEVLTHSIPDQEMMGNIDSLVASYQEDFEVEKSTSPLTPNEYREIAKRFGDNVAGMITATPSNSLSTDLQQVMIGQISVKDNAVFLRYREDEVLLKGKIPLYDGEVILIKGHFVKPGVFHVLNYEDAETAMHYQEELAIM